MDTEQLTLLAEGFRQLPPETRACMWLHFAEETGVREIATAVGKSRSATGARIRNGVEALRDFFRRRGMAVSAVPVARLVRSLPAPEAPANLPVRILARSLTASSSVPATTGFLQLAGITMSAKHAAISASVAALLLLATATMILVAPESQRAPPSPGDPPLAASDGNEAGKRRPPEALSRKNQQPVVPPPQNRATELPAFAIVVVDSEEEEAVPGAGCRLEWLETDGEGRILYEEGLEETARGVFPAAVIRAAHLRVRIDAPGFLSSETELGMPPADDARAIVVALERGQVFRARVVDALDDDRPVGGARIGPPVSKPPAGKRDPATSSRISRLPCFDATRAPAARHEVVSGADGLFSITVSNEAFGSVWVRADGFAPCQIVIRNCTGREHRIPLYPEASVHLTVVAADRTPVPAFEYMAAEPYVFEHEWGGRRVEGSAVVHRIMYTQSASYGSVTPPPRLGLGVRVGNRTVYRFFDTPLEEDVDMTVQVPDGLPHVVGRVIDPSGSPLSGARVAAVSAQHPVRVADALKVQDNGEATTTGDDGSFVLPVQGGSPALLAFHSDHPPLLTELIRVEGRTEVYAELRLLPAARLSGTLGASISPRAGRRVRLSLASFAQAPEGYRFSRTVATDDAGCFVFESLPAGLFTVSLQGDEGAAAEVTVQAGRSYEVVLDSIGGRERVDVVGWILARGQPLAGYRLRLDRFVALDRVLGEGIRFWKDVARPGDPDSELVVDRLPTGRYVAMVRGDDGFGRAAVQFEHSQGVPQFLDVPLAPAGDAKICLITPDGRVPDWAYVEVSSSGGDLLRLDGGSGRRWFRGAVLLEALPVGELRARVVASGYQPVETRLRIETSRVRAHEVEVRPAGSTTAK